MVASIISERFSHNLFPLRVPASARMMLLVSLLILLIAVMGAVHAVTPSGYNVLNVTSGGAPTCSTNVTYSCTLTNQWTASRHPTDYPAFPQLSSPVVVSHTSDYQVWAPGMTAESGFQSYAETGTPDKLLFSLLSMAKVLDVQVGESQNVLTASTQVTLPLIHVSETFSYLTVAAAIKPSPDWFGGFYGFDTIDNATNTFLKFFTIEVFPWDDGTRNGTTYNSTGSPLNPFDPITEFTMQTVPSTSVFVNPQLQSILPVATWSCELFAADVPLPCTQTPAQNPVATP